MARINIGIGEYAVSDNPDDILKTYGLGSCIALVALEPEIRAAALFHIALPFADINISKSQNQPAYFADTAVPLLISKMAEIGGHPQGRGLWIKLIGGAQVMDPNERFNIGKRNILTLRKIFWSLKLAITSEDTGGEISRTVEVDIKTGKTIITSPGMNSWII